ncbi:hypothetical protein TNCV_463151 [Trichonephila clavipes]|nr:hypothetical protein TNCV_463151 [Trichonephila clavipes]
MEANFVTLTEAAKELIWLEDVLENELLKLELKNYKSSHLGEKTGDQPTQQDKPSNLGEKTGDMPTQREKPSNLGVSRRQQVDGKKSELFKHFPLVRSLDDDEASVSLGQVTKLTPDAESQVFQRYGSGQVAFQAEPYINVPVGSAVSGGCEEVGMIHRDIYKSLPGLSHPPEC